MELCIQNNGKVLKNMKNSDIMLSETNVFSFKQKGEFQDEKAVSMLVAVSWNAYV